MSFSKLAILLPGFLDSPDYPHLVELDKELTRLGYEVVRVNPTGTWEPNADFNQYSMSHILGQVNDIVSQHPNHTIIAAGHSLGGMMSMLSAINNHSVSAAISIMGPSSFVRPEKYQERVVEWKKLPYKTSTRDLPENPQKTRKLKIPYSFVEDSLQYNVADTINSITKPLLFIAGEKDALISTDHIKSIYKRANQPKALIIIKGIGHDYRKHPDEIKLVNKQVITFLHDQHLC